MSIIFTQIIISKLIFLHSPIQIKTKPPKQCFPKSVCIFLLSFFSLSICSLSQSSHDCGKFYRPDSTPFNNHLITRRTMEKKGLTATSLLKSAEMRDKYECGICYEVCMKPVRCRGPCAKIFCMKCVSDTRQEVDRCPNRCSQPFLVKGLPQIQLDFFCPYNPTQCHEHINCLRAFDNHHRICPFVSPEELHLKKLQADYRCFAGHQLQFFLGTYEEMMQSECISCKQTQLCRSYCRICSEYYCVSCRVPPCSKEGCPIGHPFDFQRIANLDFICDICGVSTAVSNDGVYDDSACNFGICEDCFNQLPAKFDQSKPRELMANINTQCSCGKKLELLQTGNHLSICTLCTKQKCCPKYCTNCHKRYCLSCKIIDINFDNTCNFDHEFQEVRLAQGVEESYNCMRCGVSLQEFYYDRGCKTQLCYNCVDYCRRVTSDKQRPISLKCEKGHVLTYAVGSQDFYDFCVVCKQQKSIKLICMFCNQNGEGYCCECRPIPLQTCYYKHPLKLGHFQTERQCHFCRKQTVHLHYCKKCYFYACQECHGKHRPKEPMQEQHAHKIEKKQSGSTEQKMQDCKMEQFDPDKLEQEL